MPKVNENFRKVKRRGTRMELHTSFTLGKIKPGLEPFIEVYLRPIFASSILGFDHLIDVGIQFLVLFTDILFIDIIR